ncbi:MAG: hypothetical protein RQ736_08555 [Thiogranum sp.]|nr:hypothetical protein [Thiogranum sp.]
MQSEKTKGASGSENQGEGDRKSAERYNEETHEFVKSGKVEDAAEGAAGQDPQEAERSEQAGRERAREVDPAVHREYDKGQK